MLQVNFSIKESEISRFQKYRNLIGKSKKNVLTGAHKTFEGRRQLHTQMYLPAPKAQDEFKMKLPFDMVSFHLFLSSTCLTMCTTLLAYKSCFKNSCVH